MKKMQMIATIADNYQGLYSYDIRASLETTNFKFLAYKIANQL